MADALKKKEKLKAKNQITVRAQLFNQEAIPDAMMRDAFICLSYSLLTEFWMSGDTKHLIMSGAWDKLQTLGYSDEELKNFRHALNKMMQFKTTNDFMG